MRRLWLGHCCGILSVLYLLLFWLAVFTSSHNRIRMSGEQAEVAGIIAVTFALLAAILSSKRWYFAMTATSITLLLSWYANGV